MKKLLPLLLFFAIGFSSCMSLRYDHSIQRPTKLNDFPWLKTEAAVLMQPRPYAYEYYTNPSDSTLVTTVFTSEKDELHFTFEQYLRHTVDFELTSGVGKPYGKIVPHVSSHYIRQRIGGYLPSVLSVGIYPLLGLPVSRAYADISLNVEIRDSEDTVIARYPLHGSGKAWCAMYWGYNSSDYTAKAYHDAWQMMRLQLISYFENDREMLVERLKAAGPLE